MKRAKRRRSSRPSINVQMVLDAVSKALPRPKKPLLGAVKGRYVVYENVDLRDFE